MLTKDRYITFENIDCYENAKSVLDAMYELFAQNPAAWDKFWKRFEGKLPEDYANNHVDDLGRDILDFLHNSFCKHLKSTVKIHQSTYQIKS